MINLWHRKKEEDIIDELSIVENPSINFDGFEYYLESNNLYFLRKFEDVFIIAYNREDYLKGHRITMNISTNRISINAITNLDEVLEISGKLNNIIVVVNNYNKGVTDNESKKS